MTTRVDPHIKILSEDVVDRAKDNDIDVLVYAPHFKDLNTIRRECKKFSCDDITIIPGRELFTGHWSNRNHILAIGLSTPIPDFIPLKDAILEIKKQDAALLIPHPEFLTVGLSEENISFYQEHIDCIEVYNPKYWTKHSNISEKISTRKNIKPFCSSYAHIKYTIGESHMKYTSNIHTESDLVEALKNDHDYSLYKKNDMRHKFISKTEFFHNLLYEDTWEKFQRVCLSGIEKTHPKQGYYDSRFNDLCIY